MADLFLILNAVAFAAVALVPALARAITDWLVHRG